MGPCSGSLNMCADGGGGWRGRSRVKGDMHSMSMMTAANKKTKTLLEKGVWKFYTGWQVPGK